MSGAFSILRRAGRAPALLGLIGAAGIALVLELLPRLDVVPRAYIPPTSVIMVALGEEVGRPEFWDALLGTLATWMIGLGIAVAGGIIAGLVVGSVPVLRRATASTIEFLRPIPSVALLPLAVILFSTPMRSILMLVVYASFWQVLIQVLYGVADVDPVARETAASYRVGPLGRALHLVWPTTLPYAMTGIRLATTVALILTVTGELLIGGTAGIGEELAVARSSNAVPMMYAIVVVAGVLGLAANVVARLAERRVLAWHPSVRRDLAA